MKHHEDLEQAAYLRGWNDRPKGDACTGLLIGFIVGVIVGIVL